MKLLIVILGIVFAASVILAEVSFVRLVSDAQTRTERFHQDMESAFDALRANVSHHVSGITSAILGVLLPAIDKVAQHRVDCPTNVTEYDIHELLGWDLAYCTLDTDNKVVRLLNDFFETLKGPQNDSVALMTFVLKEIAATNAIDTPDRVIADVNQALALARRTFYGQSMPMLRQNVTALEGAIVTLAEETQLCVDQVLAELTEIQCLTQE